METLSRFTSEIRQVITIESVHATILGSAMNLSATRQTQTINSSRSSLARWTKPLPQGVGGAPKTGLMHEMEILEEMRGHVDSTLSDLSKADKVAPEDQIRLKSQGARLLSAIEKALLKRQIALLLEDLEKRRPVLRSFSQKYETVVALRAPQAPGVATGPVPQPATGVTQPAANMSSEEFLAELRRVREQIFHALGELNETGEVK